MDFAVFVFQAEKQPQVQTIAREGPVFLTGLSYN